MGSYITLPRVLASIGVATFAALVIWLITVFVRRENHTRERFAFVCIAAWFSLAATVTAAIAHKESFWDSLAGMIFRNTKPEPIRTADEVLMLLILSLAGYVVIQLHKSWSGAISVRQFDRQRYKRPSTLLREGADEASRILHRRPPFEPYNREYSTRLAPALDPPSGSLAWHMQARDLLSLQNPALEFDPDSGWHIEAKCWIGRNRQNGRGLAVRCADNPLSPTEVEGFVTYIRQLARTQNLRMQETDFFLAIQRAGPNRVLTADGIEVRIVTENRLLDELVDFTDYFNHVKARATKYPLPDSLLTLGDVYVPSLARREGGAKLDGTLEEYLEQWTSEPGERQLALLGEYGQGKSTSSLMFAHRQIEKAQRRPARIPILIELRGKSPQNLTPEQLLAVWAEPYRISPSSVMKLLIAGRILLILEGFDEMALVGDANSRIAHFRTLWKLCYKDAKIIITGRPNLFLDDTEMKTALGISSGTGRGPYCEALYLEPFTLEQIRAALRATPAVSRDEILDLASKDSKFRDIVSRGSLLYVVSQLWSREKLSEHKDRITSAFVMDLFIRHSYRRQVDKVANGPQFMTLNEAERDYFMCGIAAHMGASRLPNQIRGDELSFVVKQLYDVIPDAASVKAAGLPLDDHRPLKERMEETEDPATVVATDVRSCGVLVTDQSAAGTFRFAHKSFMEFLIARVMSEDIAGVPSVREVAATVRAVSHIGVGDLAASPEVLAFFTEILIGRRDISESNVGRIPSEPAQALYDLLLAGRTLDGWFRRARSRAVLGAVAACLWFYRRRFAGLFGRIAPVPLPILVIDAARIARSGTQNMMFANVTIASLLLIPSMLLEWDKSC